MKVAVNTDLVERLGRFAVESAQGVKSHLTGFNQRPAGDASSVAPLATVLPYQGEGPLGLVERPAKPSADIH